MDPRVIKTQNVLADALMCLLEQHPYKDIKVVNVVDEANVARKTFYQHFDSVYDLAVFVVDRTFDAIALSITDEMLRLPIADHGLGEFFLEAWADNATEIQHYVSCMPRHIFVGRLSHHTRRLYKRIIHVNNIVMDDRFVGDYNAGFVAGGLAGIIGTWAQRGFIDDPKTLGQYTSHQLMQGLMPFR